MGKNTLRKLRTDKGWTQRFAAERLGVSFSQYVKLERGERRLTADYIARAASAFDVPLSEIIEEKPMVPVVGYVGAGAEAHFYADAHASNEFVPMPEGGSAETVAVEVRGDSLGPFFQQWLVYYDELRYPPTPDLIGRLCVVETVEGKVLVKKLMRGSRPNRFHLLSQTESPIEDAELVWAAAVTGMTPR